MRSKKGLNCVLEVPIQVRRYERRWGFDKTLSRLRLFGEGDWRGARRDDVVKFFSAAIYSFVPSDCKLIVEPINVADQRRLEAQLQRENIKYLTCPRQEKRGEHEVAPELTGAPCRGDYSILCDQSPTLERVMLSLTAEETFLLVASARNVESAPATERPLRYRDHWRLYFERIAEYECLMSFLEHHWSLEVVTRWIDWERTVARIEELGAKYHVELAWKFPDIGDR